MARILAVDDNEDVLTLIRRGAEAGGHSVETVTTGARFMVAFSRLKPDVVILDIVMPDIDGIELIRWLRDIDAEVRIILVSGDPVGAFGHLAAKLASVNRPEQVKVLAKPFRIADLLRAISAAA